MINKDIRYIRQETLPEIGKEGQKILRSKQVLVIGAGALGSLICDRLVRAGIGKVRVVDKDYVDIVNLHRQFIYDERDAEMKRPKALAIKDKLKFANSDVEIEGYFDEINIETIHKYAKNFDLILDGTDNFETRYLINDFSIKYNIPWIYGGVVGTIGMVMPIIPKETPCFRCIFPNIPQSNSLDTCASRGIINTLPPIIGSLEVNEGIKILLKKKEINKKLFVIDIWNFSFSNINVKINERCPTCQFGNFEFLDSKN